MINLVENQKLNLKMIEKAKIMKNINLLCKTNFKKLEPTWIPKRIQNKREM